MAVTELDARRQRPQATALVDCDVHPALRSKETLDPYLPERWRRYRATFGERQHAGSVYPRQSKRAARTDAWPPSGGPPGSDLDFLREQLLDRWGARVAILNPLMDSGEWLNLEYCAAHARAVNDWQAAEWVDPEPRLRASVLVPYEDGSLAAEEIRRRAGDRRFVHVLLAIRTLEPLGRRRYWPLYEAAVEAGLPVGVHFGGWSGNPITGAGFPSFYIEEHAGMATAFQDQVISLVCEGVFQRFPRLKIVLIEGGFGWLPPLMWRLDRAWRRLREEVPHLDRLPSEVIREHFWLTTQPMEEPARPDDFHALLDELGMDDRVMFATDYPHWDFDAPDRAFPVQLDPARRERYMAANAEALYRL
jgi:predicted TIM-barrel fold metal-dependent hydrolase